MDTVGVERTAIFTGAANPERFAEDCQPYVKDPGRFDLFCSYGLTGTEQPGFGADAVTALEKCHRLGVPGVGEISDNSPQVRRGGARNAAARPRIRTLAFLPSIPSWRNIVTGYTAGKLAPGVEIPDNGIRVFCGMPEPEPIGDSTQ
jgi:hypothetical protein